jgi:hypothetical protein
MLQRAGLAPALGTRARLRPVREAARAHARRVRCAPQVTGDPEVSRRLALRNNHRSVNRQIETSARDKAFNQAGLAAAKCVALGAVCVCWHHQRALASARVARQAATPRRRVTRHWLTHRSACLCARVSARSGEAWRTLRLAWQPTFSSDSLEGYCDLMDDGARQLADVSARAACACAWRARQPAGLRCAVLWCPQALCTHARTPRVCVRARNASVLLQHLRAKAGTGEVVEMWRALGKMTLAVVGSTAYGCVGCVCRRHAPAWHDAL